VTVSATPEGVRLLAPIPDDAVDILTLEALEFIADLHRRFDARRRELLEARVLRQTELDGGAMPDFRADTRAIRQAEWSVAPIPDDLRDRRVEITGPVDRKMIINALNSGANVFMADFEDSSTPSWENMVLGQRHLADAVARTIRFESPDGKRYALGDSPATLMVRPRGWHLLEKHVTVDGAPISGSLFDFGLYLFHNAEALAARGSGPYFYLPKLEGHVEARLWNDVFVRAQEALDIPRGTIRATVLIETILAAFEMDEILYELREHSAGLNCGRWDYIFSIIKRFRNRPEFVMPDRGQVTMTTHGMRSYSLLAIQTCHHRGIHAMGGMAAQIPIKRDAAANDAALGKVRADKEREAGDGHDGTWVAHPGLVSIAKTSFDARMPNANQIERKREDVHVTARDLLTVPAGAITEKGLRHNLDVGIQYLGSWLAGSGCVPIYDLMEDAATAEISRAQVWQWIRHGAKLDDGRTVTADLVRGMLADELAATRERVGDAAFEGGTYRKAAELIERIVMQEEFAEFMTSVGYDELA
jgi:malate synthase